MLIWMNLGSRGRELIRTIIIMRKQCHIKDMGPKANSKSLTGSSKR